MKIGDSLYVTLLYEKKAYIFYSNFDLWTLVLDHLNVPTLSLSSSFSSAFRFLQWKRNCWSFHYIHYTFFHRQCNPRQLIPTLLSFYWKGNHLWLVGSWVKVIIFLGWCKVYVNLTFTRVMHVWIKIWIYPHILNIEVVKKLKRGEVFKCIYRPGWAEG